MVGKFNVESDESIMVDIANTSDEDFNAYIEKCKEMGYTKEHVLMDDMYTASNDDEYSVVITLNNDHVMEILAAKSDATVGETMDNNRAE